MKKIRPSSPAALATAAILNTEDPALLDQLFAAILRGIESKKIKIDDDFMHALGTQIFCINDKKSLKHLFNFTSKIGEKSPKIVFAELSEIALKDISHSRPVKVAQEMALALAIASKAENEIFYSDYVTKYKRVDLAIQNETSADFKVAAKYLGQMKKAIQRGYVVRLENSLAPRK